MKHGGLAGRVAINPFFRGAHFHHLTLEEDSNFGAYIPIDLHRNINHNSETGKGMDKINKRVYEWIIKKYKINHEIVVSDPTYDDFIKLSNIINNCVHIKYINGYGQEVCTIDNQKYHIAVKFNADETTELLKVKKDSNLNWSNFILLKSGILNSNEIKYNKKGRPSKTSGGKLTVNFYVTYEEGIELQKAMNNSGKQSWKSYILSIAGIQGNLPIQMVPLTEKQQTKIQFEKKKSDANIHDLKCFNCENGKDWRCKLFRTNVIDMARDGIYFENCTKYVDKNVPGSRFQTRHIILDSPECSISDIKATG
jgi:hypothetical protein